MAQNIKSILVPGEGANHLGFLPLDNVPINVVASSEHADYPAQNQIDRNAIKPYKPWRALVAGVDDEFVIDKNQVFNGGAEIGTTAGWTITGDVTVVASPVHAGAWSFQMDDAEGPAIVQQDIRVRAGEKITLQAALRGATGGTCEARIVILELGLYLNPDGVTWQTTPIVWASDSTGFTLYTASPVIPAYNILVSGGVYTLSLAFAADEGVGGVDSVVLWHWTALAQILGHNVHPVITATELHCSSDNFVGNDVTIAGAFATLIWPTSYALFTLRGERWWKFVYLGENDVPIWNGQLVLSQGSEDGGQYILDTLGRKPNYDIKFGVVLGQKRNETMTGADTVVIKEDIERREIAFTFTYVLDTHWREARNRILRQGVYGKHPIVMVYDDTNPDSAAMVRQPGRFDYTQPYIQMRKADEFLLRELAFPTFD